jgi:VCBS repeat-containing protein
VLLEEAGHRIDGQLNEFDAPGDEGELFSKLVQGKTIAQQEIEALKSEEDTALVTIDGQATQIEQATLADQVFWSQRVGSLLDGQWGFDKLLGLENKEYSKFFGLDISNKPIFISPPILGIDLGVVGADADVSFGIAGSKSKTSNYKLKAGLQIDAGYNFGGVDWNLPIYTDLQYGISNDKLNFQINNNKGADLDWIDPRLFLKVQGLINSDAAIYLGGKFNLEYVDLIETLFSWEKKVNTKSVGFDKKLNLSTNWSHNFINFDTNNKTQVVDWIFGKKEFNIGGSEQAKLDIGTLFNLGLGLPDFSKVDFKPVATTDPNLYRYSLDGSFNIFTLDFDIDDLIGSKLPIPTTYKGGDSFNIFGKKVGYEYNFALFDVNLVPSLDLNYSINLDISDVIPKFKIEDNNGSWKDFDLSKLNNLSLENKAKKLETFNYLESLDIIDGNKNGKIDFQTILDPSLKVSVKADLTPTIKLKTGLGAYNVGVSPFKKFSGYILDTPDPSLDLPIVSLFDKDLLKVHFKDVATSLGLNPSDFNSTKFSIDLNSIKTALNLPDVRKLTNNSDYFPGTDSNDLTTKGDDLVDFRGGSDVGQLSPGFDTLDGGTESNSLQALEYYYDAFGRKLTKKSILSGDIFVLDSDIYSLVNGDAKINSADDAKGTFFELDLDNKVGSTNGPDTQLRGFERIILSDDVKANSQGIKLSLADLDDFGRFEPHLNLGGVPDLNAYNSAAPLSTRHLTTTQGSDYLEVPIGYNDVPYILGDGDDFVKFVSSDTSRATPGTNFNQTEGIQYDEWKSPYGYTSTSRFPDSFYQDIIDLGNGNNQAYFTDFSPRFNVNRIPSPYPYRVLVTSVNPGHTNKIVGSFSNSQHIIQILNFGGSVDLDILPSKYLESPVVGIFSAGGNKINYSGKTRTPYGNSSLTFVLDNLGLQNKFDIQEIQEVEVELLGSQIIYRTPDPSSSSNSLTIVDNLDPDESGFGINISPADINQDSIQKELGNDETYSLQSPSNITYIVGQTPVGELGNRFYNSISLGGQSPNQKGTYRKVIIKNDFNNDLYLGTFDEVILDGNNPINSFLGLPDLSLPKFSIGSANKLNLGQLQSINTDASFSDNTRITKFKKNGNYFYEIVYSDQSDRLGILTEYNYNPNTLIGSFLNSPFVKYVPQYGHKLGNGDDTINGDADSYEFFYPGLGNNTIVNPDLSVNTYGIYDFVSYSAFLPRSDNKEQLQLVDLLSFQFDDSNPLPPAPKPPFGDVVVYNEGIRSDYLIQRSLATPNAIEVIKKDGTKDTLYGISVIKFETEDVSLIPVDNSIISPGDVTRLDNFGNDLKSRLFYSHVARPDGESFDVQLENKWAVDRVDVTQQIIRQPGQIIQQDKEISDDWKEFSETKETPLNPKNYWEYNIPINFGQNGFTLTKNFLLKKFYDVDISVKKLYTQNDLVISDIKVSQKTIQGDNSIDVEIPVESVGDQWLIKTTDVITLDSAPFEISYIITEPEGYSHLVRLNLNPSEIQSLQDLRTIFQVGTLNNEFIGSSGNDNIDGSDQDEIIRGEAGQNVLYGGGGNDQLFGGNESDFISGDAGSDLIKGGDGDDLIDGDGILASSVANSLGLAETVLDPLNANDILEGDDGDDILLGGIGDDRLIPGKGDDLIDGGEGTDTGVASSQQENYKIRKRLDGSVVVIDRRITDDNEGLELYRNTEQFEFSDQTLTVDQLPTPEGSASIDENQTLVNAQTSQGNFQLKSTEGGKILSIDTPSLEDLIIDNVVLGKSLAVLDKYRNTKGEKFDVRSSVLEFSVNTSTNSEVIELKLEQEQAANIFVKIIPSTGETFEFNYNPETGLGAELIDSNANGLVDLVRIHLKDGALGDADGIVNGVIYDPGLLALAPVNNPATISGTPTASVTEDESTPTLTAIGSLSISDADVGENQFSSAVATDPNNLGTLSITSTGTFTYSVANSAVQYLKSGQTKTETFTVKSLDGSATQNIVITLNGINDAPVAEPDKTLTLLEDSAPTPLNIAPPIDIDGDTLTILINTIPDPSKGTIRLSDGTAVTVGQSLTLDQLTSLTFAPIANANGSARSFAYTVNDGNGGIVSQTVSLFITPDNNGGSIGDPHLITFDGFHYDFQAIGDFVLVRGLDSDLEIQTRQTPWANNTATTINTALATVVDGNRIEFYVDKPLPLMNGLSLSLEVGQSQALGQGSISRTSVSGYGMEGDLYTITYPNGDELKSAVFKDFLIDVTPDLAQTKSVVGLLGNKNGKTEDDLSLRDGTIVLNPLAPENLYGAFSSSWQVTESESLFSVTGLNPVNASSLSNDSAALAQRFIFGGNGDDTLIGVDSTLLNPGKGEIDLFMGIKGADTFVLGDQKSSYYVGLGAQDYALITDLWAEDRIQLHGSASDYVLGSAPAGLTNGTGIFLASDPNELIGIIQGDGMTNLNLSNRSMFEYV